MGWKKLPLWFRAGSLVGGIYLIIALLALLSRNLTGTTGEMISPGGLVILIISSPVLVIYGLLSNIMPFELGSDTSKYFAIIIFTTICYFLIGSLIGFLVKKSKEKN